METSAGGKSPINSTPKSSPTKKETDIAQEALNHLVQGKRHLLVMDIPSAVSSLQEACGLLAGQYGETGNEVGDAYFYYGKALLEMARMETGVLGNALDGVPDGEDSDNSQVENPEKLTDEEREKVAEKVNDALKENFALYEKKKAFCEKSGAQQDENKENEPPKTDAFQDKDSADEKLKQDGPTIDVEMLNTELNEERSVENMADVEMAEIHEESESTFDNRNDTDLKNAKDKSMEAEMVNKDGNETTDFTNEDSRVKKENTPKCENEACNRREKEVDQNMREKCMSDEDTKLIYDKIIPEEREIAAEMKTTEDMEPEGKNRSEGKVSAIETDDANQIVHNVKKDYLGSDINRSSKNKEAMTVDTEPKDEVDQSQNEAEMIDTQMKGENKTETISKGQVERKTEVDENEAASEMSAASHLRSRSREGHKNMQKEESGKSTEDEESEEGESEEAEELEKVPEEDIGDKSSEDEAKPGASAGEDSEQDEIPNLQLAWEVLELAKIIFQRQANTSKQMQIKLAEVYLKLGEVSLESENYSQSIDDLTECLKIQQANFQKDNRCIAETHYQLGVAYSFAEMFDKSIENFHLAIDVIERRIANLKKAVENKDKQEEESKGKGDENPDPWYTEQGEIEELTELLPDIREKVMDTEATKEETLRKSKDTEKDDKEMDEVASSAGPSSTSVTSSSETSAKPVSNISHLVRKKRKPEEESPHVPNEAKKVKSESAAATYNGVMGETASSIASTAKELAKDVTGSKTEVEKSSEKTGESET